jgi:putative N6-adenine-specific DNA methylase
MSIDSALNKRIKRHIIGRRRTYFAAASPGFEDLCFTELSALGIPIDRMSIVDGGVEFSGQLVDCYQANLHLRTASRILLRIDRFKATGFRQLEKKAIQIPWELYLPATGVANMHVTARHCRLYHTDAVGQSISAAIGKRFTDTELDREKPDALVPDISVFVRGLDDRFTISIDSSGDHLHKRGLKRHRGIAPLRETMAAAALLLAGYKPPQPLIDPMCGTGTFSLEAASMAKNIPPGWFREFAFAHWPSFSPKRWDYLKRQCEEQFNRSRQPIIFASDQEATACHRLETCVRQNRLSDIITVSKKNFFDFHPGDVTDETGVVVINPPYGVRLGGLEESARLWDAIGDKLMQAYKGWKVVLVAPDRKLAEKIPIKLGARSFFHGGLKPVMMFGRIT